MLDNSNIKVSDNSYGNILNLNFELIEPSFSVFEQRVRNNLPNPNQNDNILNLISQLKIEISNNFYNILQVNDLCLNDYPIIYHNNLQRYTITGVTPIIYLHLDISLSISNDFELSNNQYYYLNFYR